MRNLNLSIQAQLILLVVLGLSSLAIVLQVINSIQQRDALVEGYREQSLTLTTQVSNTIDSVALFVGSLEEVTQLQEVLSDLAEENENVDFIAVADPDGNLIYHSQPALSGEQDSNLARLPRLETTREAVDSYNEVYLTSRYFDAGNLQGPQEFQVIVGMAAEPVDEQLQESVISATVATVLAVLLVSVVLLAILRANLISPIQELAKVSQDIQGGKLDLRAPNTGRRDEIGRLSTAFNSMTEQLATSIDTLETRVNERTRDLRLAGNVSRQITTVLNIDQLMKQVAGLVSTSFDFYAVIVFLLEDEGLVARATADQQGKAVDLESNRVIPLDADPSIVALAARDRKAINVGQVEKAPRYLSLTQLPETGSELAIPIQLGDNLLGVFDIQSDKADRFSPQDVTLLTTLADQIAIAVRNAQLFEETEAAREEAEQANKVKSQFLAAMSHELRTPLNAILNFTQFVSTKRMGDINEKQENALNKVVTSAKHLLGLINDVLDISKIESGALELYIEDNIDIHPELNEAIDTGRSLLKDKPVEIRLEAPESLPLLTGDRQRIRQIMLNLMSNAAKFTDEGHILVKVTHDSKEIVLSIEDTGVGIPEAEHENIFEAFRQARTGIRKGGGTGLGLAISRRLAMAHGGRLWLTSEVDKGSTFFVALPLVREAVLEKS